MTNQKLYGPKKRKAAATLASIITQERRFGATPLDIKNDETENHLFVHLIIKIKHESIKSYIILFKHFHVENIF